MDTLSKFEKLINETKISRLISGHGDSTPNKIEINTRIKESRQYINQLIESVTFNKIFNEREILEKYDFPIIMRQFHLRNIEIAKIEFKV